MKSNEKVQNAEMQKCKMQNAKQENRKREMGNGIWKMKIVEQTQNVESICSHKTLTNLHQHAEKHFAN